MPSAIVASKALQTSDSRADWWKVSSHVMRLSFVPRNSKLRWRCGSTFDRDFLRVGAEERFIRLMYSHSGSASIAEYPCHARTNRPGNAPVAFPSSITTSPDTSVAT